MTVGSALRQIGLAALAIVVLAGCQNREEILPGKREAVRPDPEVLVAERVPPLALPPATVNPSWSHRNGLAGGRYAHLAFSTNPQERWSVSIGEGNSRRARLLAAPIVAGGLVFTLDAAARLTALTPQGQVVWTRSLVPPNQTPDGGPGGGMAESDGVLYVATGFAEVMALNPATGGEYWRVSLDAPVRAAPAVEGGVVFVVTRSDAAYALSATDGQTVWRVQAAGGPGVLGGATPAVDGQLVVAPFASGEVLGLLARNGLQVWGTAVTGGRRELARNRISDITGDPIIDGRTVYASNQSGRTISLDRETGERNWTIAEGSYGPAWPVGGSVFLLSDLGALVRIDAATGGLVWLTQLPEYFEGRQHLAVVHYGPILAGGRLWTASSDGLLRSFSPTNGQLLGTLPLPEGAAAPPALAGGVMYVVTQDGRLHAFQ